MRARLARLLAAPAEAPPRAPPPPQTNGASAPPPDAPEARSLSVVASSVMALGVLPGEELKRMLDNFCASLPPDEFKALLLSIGANLAPRVHKNLVLLLAPDAVSRLLDRTALAGYGDVGRNASRAALGRALPRRVAKTLVNRWLRDADAVELKRVVTFGLAKLGPGRLAELAPVCLAAIFGERPQVAPPPPAAPPAEEPVVLPATVAAWAAPRLALALGRDRRRAAVLRAIAGLSDGDARALLNDLSLSWAGAGRGDRDRQLADVVDIALSDPSEPRNGERALARRLPTDVKNDLVKTLAPYLTNDFLFRSFPEARRAADGALRLLGVGTAPNLAPTTEGRLLQARDVARIARDRDLEARVMRAAVKALSTPRDVSVPFANIPIVSRPRVGERKPDGDFLVPATGPGPTVETADAVKTVAETAVSDAVDTLPPALVAKQLRTLVARLPADFVRAEAVTLLETLPADELVDATVGLVDAAPEGVLRRLAGRLLDLAAQSRLRATGGELTGGVVTLQSLAVAVNAYDVGLLRSTAKTLLRGAPPKNLAAKVKQILEATPGATIQNAVLRALDAAAAKGAEYDTLRSMMGAGAPSRVEAEADVEEKPDLAGSLKRLFLEKQQDLNGLRGGAREDESEGEVPLEAVLLDVVNELNPELLIALSLDTLAALPPEAYESLSRLLVVGIWDRLVLQQLPPAVSEGLKEVVDTVSDTANASLLVSYVEAGAGGVVGGAAAKGSLNILLGGKAGAALGGTTLGAAAKAGVAGAAAFKGLALTSIFYAGKLFLFSDSQPESLDQAWATVAEEAFLSSFLLVAATLGVAAYDRRDKGDDASRFREAGDRSRAALAALLLGPDSDPFADRDLEKALKKAARDPPRRGAAAVCRNLLLDEYLDADAAETLRWKFANPAPRAPPPKPPPPNETEAASPSFLANLFSTFKKAPNATADAAAEGAAEGGGDAGGADDDAEDDADADAPADSPAGVATLYDAPGAAAP